MYTQVYVPASTPPAGHTNLGVGLATGQGLAKKPEGVQVPAGDCRRLWCAAARRPSVESRYSEEQLREKSPAKHYRDSFPRASVFFLYVSSHLGWVKYLEYPCMIPLAVQEESKSWREDSLGSSINKPTLRQRHVHQHASCC